MKRSQGKEQQTIGEAILSQAGAQAWNQANQMLWKTKATLAGDLLGDVWSKVASVNAGHRRDRRPPRRESPFGHCRSRTVALGAMASVAIDLALNAVSAIPVAGWIIGIVVGIGKALAALFRGDSNDKVPPEQRARFRGSDTIEMSIKSGSAPSSTSTAAGVDWTPMFAPPTDAIPGSSSTALTRTTPRTSSARSSPPSPTRPSPTTACTAASRARSASRASSSTAPARSGPTRPLRFYNDGTIIQQHGDFTQTGDFFPPAAARGDHLAADRGRRPGRVQGRLREAREACGATGSPRSTPRRWSRGTATISCRTSRARSTASGAWAPTPRASGRRPRPTGRRCRSSRGHLQEWRPGDPEVAHHLHVHRGHGQGRARRSNDLGPPMDAGRQDRRVHRPAALPWAGRKGHLCVPWPPGDLLLSKYRRADDAITTPAVKAVAQLQRSRLSRSLDCAYVRPRRSTIARPTPRSPAGNTSLRDHCIEMRKRLLKAPRAHAGRVRDRARGRQGVRRRAARRRGPDHADEASRR
jgi:hypothetical protein